MKKAIKNIGSRKALTIVAVMWIIVLLTVIITVVAQSSRIDTRITMVSAENIRNKWACRGGIEKAIAILNEDDAGTDSFEDLWYENPEDCNDVPLDGCSFTVKIIDESSKLNINTATEKQLSYLPYITEDIINSILDWRDGNDDIRTGGAEAGYYYNLPHGYRIRNGGFKTIRELLRVKDVSKALFYGSGGNPAWIDCLTCYSYDTNKDSSDEDKININRGSESQLATQLSITNQQAKWIVENRNFDKVGDLIKNNSPSQPPRSSGNSNNAQQMDRQTFFQIVDKVTVTGTDIPGKVNINTVSRTALMAVLEGNEDLTNAIISYRQQMSTGFTTLGDLSQIETFTNDNIIKYIDLFTTRSSVFTIRSHAKANATSAVRVVETVVDRGKSPVEMIYWRSGVNN